jgi:small subunit ribosomal protein S6
MAFYENTIVAKQDLAEKELKTIKEKYNELINKSSGKVIKIEEWGLLNLANKIKNYKKGFYIHYKFEGNKDTIIEIEKKRLTKNIESPETEEIKKNNSEEKQEDEKQIINS